MSEQHTEQTIKVRQITDVHANWSSQGPLENGKFSYQLILDNGAEEALIMPTADDAKVLRDLIHDAEALYWDTEKEIIIFAAVMTAFCIALFRYFLGLPIPILIIPGVVYI